MQPLPPVWVDSLFARIQVRYGAAWVRMWEGIDMAAVKADWAEELGGFAARPDAIKHALGNLPTDRPPTVAQFRALCIASPQETPKALPAPKASADVVSRAVASALSADRNNDPKAWAHRLRQREFQCARLTIFQRKAWREALGAAA